MILYILFTPLSISICKLHCLFCIFFSLFCPLPFACLLSLAVYSLWLIFHYMLVLLSWISAFVFEYKMYRCSCFWAYKSLTCFFYWYLYVSSNDFQLFRCICYHFLLPSCWNHWIYIFYIFYKNKLLHYKILLLYCNKKIIAYLLYFNTFYYIIIYQLT